MSDKIIHTGDFMSPEVQAVEAGRERKGFSCYMTVQASECDSARDEGFGSGTFEEMCGVLNTIAASYAGQYHPFQMTAELSIDQLKLHFSLKNREHASIFIGRKAQHLQIIFNWLRAQQIYPHNRKIQITISKEEEEDGEQIQSFWDLNDGFWSRGGSRRKK